jgi:hypothetical protein
VPPAFVALQEWVTQLVSERTVTAGQPLVDAIGEETCQPNMTLDVYQSLTPFVPASSA